MTETNLSQTIQATPLVSFLAASRPQPELIAYRGVLTPACLDETEREIDSLAHGAAIYDLGWKRRVAVRGEDRFRWLSGMVTNTVNDLFPNSGAWNYVLNAQGHILGDVAVWRGAEELSPLHRNPAGDAKTALAQSDPMQGTPFAGESGLELELDADQLEKLLEHFNRFIIMDDVELVVLHEKVAGHPAAEVTLGLSGPQAAEVLERMGLPSFALPLRGAQVDWNGWSVRIQRTYGVLTPHYELRIPAAGLRKLWLFLSAAGAVPVGVESLEAFRVAEGIPAYGIDIAERDLPQETSQMRALHFNKGCYQGQEVVERIHARGNVRRHLRPIELDGPLPVAGTKLLLASGSEAGTITSAAALPLAGHTRAFALAMLRAEAETGEQSFSYAAGETSGKARILATPPTL
jgi:folate-binding protein YgfZ